MANQQSCNTFGFRGDEPMASTVMTYYNYPFHAYELSTPMVGLLTTQEARERMGAMAESAEPSDAAFDFQVVREFLERYFTIENEIKVLQHDKSALRDEFKGRGLDMKTMTAAIAIAKKRQLVPVSKETLDELISEVEHKLPAPDD